jgi:Tol biopolymer transport system component
MWAPDGRGIIYVATRSGVANLWRQPLDGSKPAQLTNFPAELIAGLSLATDGKRIALSRGHSTLDVVLIKDARNQ